MTMTDKQILGAVAIAAVAYWLGKRHAAPAASGANTNIAEPAEWWTYASAWGG